MKTTKLYSTILFLFAAMIFTACSNDDDEQSEKNRNAITMMKGSYIGTLETTDENGEERILVGVNATSDDTLCIRLPLELVAEQIKMFNTVYETLSTQGYADVKIVLDSIQNDNGNVRFNLRPLDFTIPCPNYAPQSTDESSNEFGLSFANNGNGHYQDGRMEFDLSIAKITMNGNVLNPFRPVHFHYEGSTDISLTDGRHIQKMQQTLESKWATVYSMLIEKNGITWVTFYERRSLTFRFNNGTYIRDEIDVDGNLTKETGTYTIKWAQWGNEHHLLHLTKAGDLFPYTSYNIDLTSCSLCMTWADSNGSQSIIRLVAATND